MIKTCSKCNIEKDESEFYRDKASTDGFRYYCKVCSKESAALWEKNNPTRVADRHQQRKFGLANGRKAAMIAEQDNKCAMCGDLFIKQICTDHDHSVTAFILVRDILCNGCNTIIGHAKDQRERLLQGVAYLDKWEKIKFDLYISKGIQLT